MFLWQGQKDSNPQQRFWRPTCYHYTMPLRKGYSIIAGCLCQLRILRSLASRRARSAGEPARMPPRTAIRTSPGSRTGLGLRLSLSENLRVGPLSPRPMDRPSRGHAHRFETAQTAPSNARFAMYDVPDPCEPAFGLRFSVSFGHGRVTRRFYLSTNLWFNIASRWVLRR